VVVQNFLQEFCYGVSNKHSFKDIVVSFKPLESKTTVTLLFSLNY